MFKAFLVAHLVKSPPAMRETWIQSLGWEDSPGERNRYPFQYSGLENPGDGGAWWAAIYGVAQSRTQLKRLSSSSSSSNDPDDKESACNAGDPGSIPGLGRFPWRKEWLATPVFLPGKSHGQRSLVGNGGP